MEEAIAIVIAAFISVAGIVLTQWFNYRQRKDDSKERFIYEIYPRRLALYEEVIRTLEAIGMPKKVLVEMPPVELQEKLFGDRHTLLTLSSRLNIYGSAEARKILNSLMEKMRDTINNNFLLSMNKNSEDGSINSIASAVIHASNIDSLLHLIEETLTEFSECVGKETGSDFVDKRIKKFLKKGS